MRLRLLTAFAILAAAPVTAVEIRSYELQLAIDDAGAGSATATILIEAAEPGMLIVPLGFPAVTDVSLTEAPAGTSLAPLPKNNQVLLRLTLPDGVPASTRVAFEFRVKQVLSVPSTGRDDDSGESAEKRRIFRHSLLCTQPEGIGRYRFEVVFPDGMRAHTVREALPKPRTGELAQRALLDDIAGQPGLCLQVDNLVQGETAAVSIELVPRSRPLIWLLAGVALSLLYLVRFRDLVSGTH